MSKPNKKEILEWNKLRDKIAETNIKLRISPDDDELLSYSYYLSAKFGQMLQRLDIYDKFSMAMDFEYQMAECGVESHAAAELLYKTLYGEKFYKDYMDEDLEYFT